MRRPPESELAADVVAEFYEALLDLETTEKWRIDALTEIAAQQVAQGFLHETAYALEQRIETAQPAHKLPVWYLLDSITKAVGPPMQEALEETLPELIVHHMDFDHPKLSEKYTELITVWSETKLFPPSMFTRVEALIAQAAAKPNRCPPPVPPQLSATPQLPAAPSASSLPPLLLNTPAALPLPTAFVGASTPLWPLLPLWAPALLPLDAGAQRRQRTQFMRDLLYNPQKVACGVCALRLSNAAALAKHKEEHAQQQTQNTALSRRWLPAASEWVVTDWRREPPAVAPLADILEQKARPKPVVTAKRRAVAEPPDTADVTFPVVDSNDHLCAICREPMRKYLNARDEWALADSVLVAAGDPPVVCHKGCRMFLPEAKRARTA
jgi:hypothetical protein